MGYQCGVVCVLACVLLVAGLVAAEDLEGQEKLRKAAIAKFEDALMKEMGQILENNKKKGKSDDESKSELSAAMERVKHLKPDNMAPQDLIGVMGRVMQEKMGLNIGIQTQNPDGTMGPAPSGDKKSKKKKKGGMKKGPSLSKSGEL